MGWTKTGSAAAAAGPLHLRLCVLQSIIESWYHRQHGQVVQQVARPVQPPVAVHADVQNLRMSFQNSTSEGSPHHFLSQLVGGWKGMARLWLEPGVLADESPVLGSIHLVLQGRFAIYLYQGSIEGEPQHGMFTFGYNTTLDQYEGSWLDSFHNNTAIMCCVGGQKVNGFWVQGTYPDPAGGPDWEWRTELELVDREHLTLTAYNISPEGQESKAAETVLIRVK
jgi:hypothetical protein